MYLRLDVLLVISSIPSGISIPSKYRMAFSITCFPCSVRSAVEYSDTPIITKRWGSSVPLQLLPAEKSAIVVYSGCETGEASTSKPDVFVHVLIAVTALVVQRVNRGSEPLSMFRPRNTGCSGRETEILRSCVLIAFPQFQPVFFRRKGLSRSIGLSYALSAVKPVEPLLGTEPRTSTSYEL